MNSCAKFLSAAVLGLVFEMPLQGAESTTSKREPLPLNSPANDQLPVTGVILYSTGVGYFERTGEVEGKARVELKFKVEDVNDLLKSMVVQDFGGGQVTSVSYGSRDPLNKTLKTFALDLTSNPSLGQLLNQARGEQIEIATVNIVTGTILGTEKRKKSDPEGRSYEVEYLNLVTSSGIMSVALDSVAYYKLLDPRLNQELRQALETLASGHDTQKKSVAVSFDGEGKRKVSVAYVAASSVWKTSYRLVIGEKEPYLQGWAIVENTTDEDWKQVRLSMVSGRPVAFTMDLYQPIHVSRPVVQPEVKLALGPQVYSDAMESESLTRGSGTIVANASPPPTSAPSALGRSLRTAAIGAESAKAIAEDSGMVARYGLQPQMMARASVVAAAEGGTAGELFYYAIKEPVTIARQQSAMLPIISSKVNGDKISIYNEAAHKKHPMNGFRLKNSSPLHLMQGPITVFEGNSYAGDARVEDLAPGQERLISYALDLKVEVDPRETRYSERDRVVTIRKGILNASYKRVMEKEYVVRNRDAQTRQVLVEHPVAAGWELVEPKVPLERARDTYRFQVKVDANKVEHLKVRTEITDRSSVALSEELLSELIQVEIQRAKVSDKVKQALEKVVVLRQRNAKTKAELVSKEARITEITIEQARIRENMGRLAQNSELYQRYVRTFDSQETEIETLRSQIASLKKKEQAEQAELSDYVLGLDLD